MKSTFFFATLAVGTATFATAQDTEHLRGSASVRDCTPISGTHATVSGCALCPSGHRWWPCNLTPALCEGECEPQNAPTSRCTPIEGMYASEAGCAKCPTGYEWDPCSTNKCEGECEPENETDENETENAPADAPSIPTTAPVTTIFPPTVFPSLTSTAAPAPGPVLSQDAVVE